MPASWKIGQTVLHSPQLTQLSARAAADCGASFDFVRGAALSATAGVSPGVVARKLAPIAAGSPRPRAGPGKSRNTPRSTLPMLAPAFPASRLVRSLTPGTIVAPT